MEVTNLAAKQRTALGKRQIYRLREEGQVPAVVYGLQKEPTAVSLDGRELERELRKRHRVFQMSLGGTTEAVYLQALQLDALTDMPLHADFLRIELDKPLATAVELVVVGIPVGLSKGGVLVRSLKRLRVNSLPAAIPSNIEVRVANLDVGQKLVAKDLELPEGVTLGVPAETVICHVTE